MIDFIVERYRQAVAEAKHKRVALETETRIFSEASDLVTERPDKDGWVKMGQTNDREKGMLQTTQLEMIRQARKFSRFDPNAKAALSSYVNYIMGKGLTITPKGDDPKQWYVWREFWTSVRNRMTVKQFEIVLRSLRDGELFIRFFKRDDAGKNTGKTTIRFVDPLLVRSKETEISDPTKAINNGVITDPDDVEKVLKYTVQTVSNQDDYYDVPADEMLHVKINVDSDQKRGETQLLAVLGMFKHYEQWLENRIILNKMRSAIVLVRSIESATPTEVASMAATIPTARNPSTESKRQQIRGGTVLTAGPGVKYDMLSANINATDAKEDGRNIKTNIAAALNMPEYIFGDASNQNYASSLIAESPFVKAIQFWQIFFENVFSQIYRKVMEIAVEAGALEAPNDDEFISKLDQFRGLAEGIPDPTTGKPPKTGAEVNGNGDKDAPDDSETDPLKPALSPRQALMQELMPNGKMEMPSEIFFGCDMDWPEIVHRDLKQQVEALALARSNGWIADSTACAAMGYDYSEEVRKQRQTEEEAGQAHNPLLGLGGVTGDDGQMDAEMEDMLNQLSPEERDQVLKAKDPREVVRLMNKRKAPVGAGAEGE